MKKPRIGYCLVQTYIIIALLFLLNACGGGGGGGGSSGQSGNTNLSSLAYPASITVNAGDGEVTLSWLSVTGATSYNIYINDATYVSKSSYITKTSSATSPITVSGLQNNVQHSVMITATDAGGESGASPSYQFTPSAPSPSAVSDFTAVASNKQVAVSWTAVAYATGYIIERAASADFTDSVLLHTSSTSATFTDLTNGTTYYYKILAENNSGQSDYSSVISATPNLGSGWNLFDEIARHSDSGFGEIISRSDNMNSKRDVLSAWTYYDSYYDYGHVYANTYSKSADWGSQTLISSSGFESASALSENGDGAVVWAEKTYLDQNQLTWRYDIFVKHYQAGIWGDAIQLSGSESGTYPSDPTIELDKDGNAVVAWHADDNNFYAKTYDKATDSWSAVTQVNAATNPYVGYVRISVDNNGVFVLAWGESATASGLNKVYVRKYSKAAAWQGAEAVNTDDPLLDANNELLSVSVTGNGDIFMLWGHSPPNTDAKLLLRKYSSTTSTWASPVTVDTTNVYIDDAIVKTDATANAIIYWEKRHNDGITIIASNNFAVYDKASDSIGPTEQMLLTDYKIYTADVVSDADYSFRMFYGVEASSYAYQRVYDFNAQTWSDPETVVIGFGNSDYIATSNPAGEILLTTSDIDFDYFSLDKWQIANAVFYLP